MADIAHTHAQALVVSGPALAGQALAIDAFFAAQLPWPRRARSSEARAAVLRSELAPDLLARMPAAGSGPLAAPALLLAAFAALLARYSGEPALGLGLQCAPERPHAPPPIELQPLALGAELTLAELQGQLAARLSAPHIGDRSFESEWSISASYDLRLDGAAPHGVAEQAPGDLHLALAESHEGITITWVYRSERFSQPTVARMDGHFQALVRAALARRAEPIGRLALLGQEELEQLLVAWNQTDQPYPDQDTAHTLFERHARATPDATAITYLGVEMSYAELNRRANQLARHLRALGVGGGEIVAIGVERSPDLLVAILAVLKAGGVYLPLDPSYPPERLAYMLSDAHAQVLITSSVANLHVALADALAGDPVAPQPRAVLLDRDWPLIAEQPSADLGLPADPDQLGYVIYTSGSTGRPKGTLLAHRGLCSLVRAQQEMFALTPADRVLQFASCSFDASVWEWAMALCTGATLCMAPQSVMSSPPDLHALLQAERVTVATLPPTLLRVLAADGLPDLRVLVTAGEACAPELVSRWAQGRQFINAYGPTETTVCASWYRCSADERSAPPIGRPLPNMQLYVLDAHQQPVPIGVAGELYVGGFALARGYLNRPELTAERFISWRSPLQPDREQRLYRTGDLVRYREDGNIEFIGRLDHQIKLRGFRVELAEIDAAMRQVPGVRESYVLLREDAPGMQRLVSYLTLSEEPGDRASFRRALRAQLAERLPAYMVPSAYVILDALPLSPNGKIDRRALRPPQPEDDSATLTPPRNDQEAQLASIWAEVLGRPAIGVDDDFFALGGHSLMTAQLSARVSAALGRPVPMTLIYEAPTVAAYAAALSSRAGSAQLSAADLRRDVALDPQIAPPAGSALLSTPQSARAIFLSGVTGFLGAFLLRELLEQTSAQIYCLVRAKSSAEAAARITQALARSQIDLARYQARVTPVIGDLREQRLGLAERAFQQLAATVDLIYHAGANVHYLHSYSALRGANVGGTVEVLRLACAERLKPVNYVSSIAVAIANGERHAREDAELADCVSHVGYDQSKWVAESIMRLARARGVPVAIYRPGRIGSHSQTGASNRDDYFLRLLAGSLQVGSAPDVPMIENITPVDYVARAIVAISGAAGAGGHTYHLLNPHTLRWGDVVDMLRARGWQLELAPYDRWHALVRSVGSASPSAVLASLSMMMPEHPDAGHWESPFSEYVFDRQNAQRDLAGRLDECPPIDMDYLERMIADAAQHGLLELPLHESRAHPPPAPHEAGVAEGHR